MNLHFLFFALLAVAVQGFFAFFEMACVSFNKVRLQYYVSLGSRRAIWIEYLLKRPSCLFGTTLIGITTSLVIGSECARRFYESIHVNPDWATLSQFPLVVIFGELAPMFAARRHPEQAAMLCIPIMIVIARLLTPFTWAFDQLSQLIHRAMGKQKEVPLFLSREEVRLAFEEREEGENEFDAAASHIFQLKNLTAGQLMVPLDQIATVSSNATIGDIKKGGRLEMFIPIYHRNPNNIVAVVFLRDLLRYSEGKRILDVAHSPWFVTRDTSILHLLKQFRSNNQSLAVILNPSAETIGLLTLDQILAEIFGEEATIDVAEKEYHIERTLSGEMSVAEFNRKFEAKLHDHEGNTLNDLILAELGHLPVQDEVLKLGDFEFTVEDAGLGGIKTVSVKSIRD